MAETSYPFQTGAGDEVTEARWRSLAGRYLPSGVIGALFRDASDTSLTPSIPGGGGGPTFGMTAGEAFVSGVKYDNSASLTKVGTNNASSDPRIDRLVLKLDTSAKTITAAILPGTASSTPVPPSTAPSGSNIFLTIARATVPGSGTNYTNLVDERVFTGVRHIVGPSTGSGATMASGDTWFQTDTGLWLMHDGSTIRPIGEVLLGQAETVGDEDFAAGTTGSQDFTKDRASAGVVGTSFVAPPSGKVDIRYAAGIRADLADRFGNVSFRVGEDGTLGAGTEIVAPTLDRSLQHAGTLEDQQGRTDLVTGLTPGDTYNVVLMFRVNVGVGTFSRASVSVDPKLA